MDIVELDFETFFSDDYTLSKMPTEEYVRDERFEAHGCGIRHRGGGWDKAQWYTRPNLPGLFAQIDWSNTALMCHHGQFDGLILSHHYDVVPALYICTLSMGRALMGPQISKSLGGLAEAFGLGEKTIPYDKFRGKHWEELTPQVRDEVARGCCDDVLLMGQLFDRMAQAFPQEEYALVDATVRMFTQPRIIGDTERLGEIWTQEQARKTALLAELDMTEADIRKDWAFAKLLREHGIEPEQKRMKAAQCKPCGGTGFADGVDRGSGQCDKCEGKGTLDRYKYAFAKTDDFMRDLQDHEDEDVRLMAEAKLAAHSTGTQTRTMRLGWMSTRGAMPVYLNYCGTHVKGWSGGDKVNWQNFRRGGPIAGALQAPKGHAFVIADSSQCECRLLEEVAGEDMTDWREGKDPYTTLATEFYGEEIYKPAKDDPRRFEMEEKRGTGKQLRLSCGYGAGALTIKITAKKGVYGPPVYLTDEESLQARDVYRDNKQGVVRLWRSANDVLKKMHSGLAFEWGPVYIQDRRMWFPNGLPAIYETLKWEDDPEDGGDAGWRVRVNKNGWSRMYGAKLVENLIQGLRNVLIRQAWLRLRAQGIEMVSMEHDKLCAIAPANDAPAALKLMQHEMCKAPTWLPGVPLDSEGYVSDTFAKPDK